MSSDKAYNVEDRLNAMIGIAATLTTASLSNFTAESVIGTWTIPTSDTLNGVPGAVYRLIGRGQVSTTGTPTLQLRLRLNGLTGPAIIDTGAVVTTNNTNGSGILVDASVCIETVGISGSWTCWGRIYSKTPIAQYDGFSYGQPANTTNPLVAVLTAAWSVANAANSVGTVIGQVSRVRAG